MSPLLAGVVAKTYGAKYPLLASFVGLAILTLLTPLIVPFGWEWMCVSRFFQGIGQGIKYPCVLVLMANWIPSDERGMMSMVFMGTGLGTAFSIGISGAIAASSIGWPGIFYVSGGICFVMAIAWALLCANTPADCSGISKEERNYLDAMPGITTRALPIPWRHIFASPPFWAILLAMCANTWMFVTLSTNIPSYINGVLDYPISSVRRALSSKSNTLIHKCSVVVTIIIVSVFRMLCYQHSRIF